MSATDRETDGHQHRLKPSTMWVGT